jgi:hypothetical protein
VLDVSLEETLQPSVTKAPSRGEALAMPVGSALTPAPVSSGRRRTQRELLDHFCVLTSFFSIFPVRAAAA